MTSLQKKILCNVGYWGVVITGTVHIIGVFLGIFEPLGAGYLIVIGFILMIYIGDMLE